MRSHDICQWQNGDMRKHTKEARKKYEDFSCVFMRELIFFPQMNICSFTKLKDAVGDLRQKIATGTFEIGMIIGRIAKFDVKGAVVYSGLLGSQYCAHFEQILFRFRLPPVPWLRLSPRKTWRRSENH
jgi:hypothetical protein